MGQAGDGTTTTPRLNPGPVAGVTGAKAITAGNKVSCALMPNGSVQCWGDNALGQGGSGNVVSPQLTPTAVTGLPGPVSQIISGYGEHVCATTTAGQMFCWGKNSYGQLGNGTTTASDTAAAVLW
jgi:alpha-tubulin suppressor-like RCC1 family protein